MKDFEEKGMSEILKKSSKTGDRFTVISDLQNNEERVWFQPGNRQLSRKFPEQVYSPKVPESILVSRDKDTSAFLWAILENFDLRGKSSSFEMAGNTSGLDPWGWFFHRLIIINTCIFYLGIGLAAVIVGRNFKWWGKGYCGTRI